MSNVIIYKIHFPLAIYINILALNYFGSLKESKTHVSTAFNTSTAYARGMGLHLQLQETKYRRKTYMG